MSDIYMKMGAGLCIIGGVILALLALGLLAYFMCAAWIVASDKFRAILRGESLIYEYKKNRDKYLEWKRARDD